MQLSAAAVAAVAVVTAAAVALFQLQSERNYRYNARCLRASVSAEKKLPESVVEEAHPEFLRVCLACRAFSSALRSLLRFNSRSIRDTAGSGVSIAACAKNRDRKKEKGAPRKKERQRRGGGRTENAIVRKRILSLAAYLTHVSRRCVVICKAITLPRARFLARFSTFRAADASSGQGGDR